jgi:hypothetical protein
MARSMGRGPGIPTMHRGRGRDCAEPTVPIEQDWLGIVRKLLAGAGGHRWRVAGGVMRPRWWQKHGGARRRADDATRGSGCASGSTRPTSAGPM